MALMVTSPEGRSALEDREGVRLEAYHDSVGVLTIGVGHTGRTAPPAVYPGMKITRSQVDDFLLADLGPVQATVNEITRGKATQNQFNAMVSLGFNIGHDKLKTSTVARKFASGDVQGAADAFLLWNKPPELVGRRRAERAQFLRPDGDAHPSLTSGLSQVTDVASLQSALFKAGGYSGPVDGDFGPLTLAAVKKFQADHGLDVDGIVGEDTYAALDSALLESAKAKVEAALVRAPDPEPAAQAGKVIATARPESLWDRLKAVFKSGGTP